MEYVVVSATVKFDSTYEDVIQKHENIFKQWCRDNIGYTPKLDEMSYTLIEDKAYYRFIFKTKEDAVAFKLMWNE